MVGFTLNGTSYYYVKNLQGDVIGILDSTGMLVVQYTYDAWGKLLSITDGNGTAITNTSHVAYRNPIRYRGYVYYDPNTGRFINQDMAEIILEDQGFLGQHNLYAYCGNNPVMGVDVNGHFVLSLSACLIAGLLAGASGFAAGAAIYGVSYAAMYIGAKLTAGSCGTLGKAIYNSWQKAEQALRSAYNGVKRTFNTPFGNRIVDCFSKNVAREAKYGHQGLSKFIQQEINKDYWLLKKGFKVIYH